MPFYRLLVHVRVFDNSYPPQLVSSRPSANNYNVEPACGPFHASTFPVSLPQPFFVVADGLSKRSCETIVTETQKPAIVRSISWHVEYLESKSI